MIYFDVTCVMWTILFQFVSIQSSNSAEFPLHITFQGDSVFTTLASDATLNHLRSVTHTTFRLDPLTTWLEFRHAGQIVNDGSLADQGLSSDTVIDVQLVHNGKHYDSSVDCSGGAQFFILNVMDAICSPDGNTRAVLQMNGNFVLFTRHNETETWREIWSSACSDKLENDFIPVLYVDNSWGNLAIYQMASNSTRRNDCIWETMRNYARGHTIGTTTLTVGNNGVMRLILSHMRISCFDFFKR
eukprot:198013_1